MDGFFMCSRQLFSGVVPLSSPAGAMNLAEFVGAVFDHARPMGPIGSMGGA